MLGQAQREAKVEFDWLSETFPDCQRLFQTLQRESIVEYSAVAMAFLVMTNLVEKNISEVTLRGSKADYFGATVFCVGQDYVDRVAPSGATCL